jgi:methylation protein EvaC
MTSQNYICRISGSSLMPFLDLGKQPLGNGFVIESDFSHEYFYSMMVGFSPESNMVQLLNQPNPELMFHGKYAFYSSTSVTMAQHFSDFSSSVINSQYLSKEDPFVIELGCNDGIMLKHFAQRGIKHLGIEPSINVAKVANANGVKTISEFFSSKLAGDILTNFGKADVFLAANVMCHIPHIKDVALAVSSLLKKTGVLIFEDPYLGDVIEKTSYDQIYDEHVFLFSVHSVKYLFNLYGMDLIDVQWQKTHGGSMRYTVSHSGAYPISDNVTNLLEKEKKIGLDKSGTFDSFRVNVERSKFELTNLLKKLKSEGKRICGYGATSKSTTILNYCGIGKETIDYISDITPIKVGKFSPGMHIPIVPHKAFIENPPDYALLFAWNHAEEIMAKEKNFTDSGGKWIVHVPEVKIL